MLTTNHRLAKSSDSSQKTSSFQDHACCGFANASSTAFLDVYASSTLTDIAFVVLNEGNTDCELSTITVLLTCALSEDCTGSDDAPALVDSKNVVEGIAVAELLPAE